MFITTRVKTFFLKTFLQSLIKAYICCASVLSKTVLNVTLSNRLFHYCQRAFTVYLYQKCEKNRATDMPIGQVWLGLELDFPFKTAVTL